jgi:uncharacterized SAM-binding protein YcdF (DUF218 family)
LIKWARIVNLLINSMSPRSVAKADAIVVLGCAGSARLQRRVECGVRLYQEGVAPVLLLSGGGHGPEPEAEIMRRIALTGGVPQVALLIEPNSRDTLGNAHETARLLRAHGLRTVVLVSDRAHLLRAAPLFRLAGVAIAGRSGLRAPSLLREIVATIREMAALPFSLVRALLAERESRRR